MTEKSNVIPAKEAEKHDIDLTKHPKFGETVRYFRRNTSEPCVAIVSRVVVTKGVAFLDLAIWNGFIWQRDVNVPPAPPDRPPGEMSEGDWVTMISQASQGSLGYWKPL